MILRADARYIPLPDEFVQCVVTSPPYWGLRKYAGEQELIWGGREGCEHEWMDATAHKRGHPGDKSTLLGTQTANLSKEAISVGGSCQLCGAWRGAYGLEPTVEMYVAHTVEILREIRRVLRKDGVVFWNLGDSHFAHNGTRGGNQPWDDNKNPGAIGMTPHRAFPGPGLKPKDLCLIPFRVALAAQADGWWVRSVIIWSKPNPMPGSVRDRPTDAFEYILMLTKSERYFWDGDAVREPYKPESLGRHRYSLDGTAPTSRQPGGDMERRKREAHVHDPNPAGRNLRNVWTFATQPYSGAHFATFPEELPRRCIKAATSEKGSCRFCGAPWERVVKTSGGTWDKRKASGAPSRYGIDNVEAQSSAWTGYTDSTTIGWRPTCACGGQHGKTAPCLVLDPFGGSGTTAKVAIELGRRAVSLDLAYHELAKRRTAEPQPQLVMA